MTHRINHHRDETACCECGCPLYVGDIVYTDESEREGYCSNDCQRAAADHWLREEDADACEQCGGPARSNPRNCQEDGKEFCTPTCARLYQRENAPLRKSQPIGVKAGCFDV